LGSGISSCGFTRGSLASVPLTVTSGRTSVDSRVASLKEQGATLEPKTLIADGYDYKK
jgi:hypothetical protein